jgi:hypothetical protein
MLATPNHAQGIHCYTASLDSPECHTARQSRYRGGALTVGSRLTASLKPTPTWERLGDLGDPWKSADLSHMRTSCAWWRSFKGLFEISLTWPRSTSLIFLLHQRV